MKESAINWINQQIYYFNSLVLTIYFQPNAEW
jgi:hypothetical protein